MLCFLYALSLNQILNLYTIMKRIFSQPPIQKNKNLSILCMIFWFYRSLQKAIATSKIHDDQWLGDQRRYKIPQRMSFSESNDPLQFLTFWGAHITLTTSNFLDQSKLYVCKIFNSLYQNQISKEITHWKSTLIIWWCYFIFLLFITHFY